MVDMLGVSHEQIETLKSAKMALRLAESDISQTVLKHIGLQKGDLVRHRYNGLVYEIDYGYAYVDDGMFPRVSVAARRKYQSGRRAGRTAASSSHISWNDLEKL